MKKIIFLDIDGVLNTAAFIQSFWTVCGLAQKGRDEARKLRLELLRDGYGNIFCPTATEMLEYVIKETQADIVISSSWRHSGIEVMQEMWKHRELPGNVVDVTPSLVNKRDGEGYERAERGLEINEWLKLHTIDRYCIIDDDRDMLDLQKPFFVQTNPIYGLTDVDARNVIKILNT